MRTTTTEPGKRMADDLRSAADAEMRGTKQTLHETKDDLSEKASGLAADAKDAMSKQAETAKQSLGDHLDALGGAARAARDHLESSQHTTASKLVGEVSDGLGRLASSLRDKSIGEFLDDLRDAGRNNTGGVFAGSLLAGLALGRLLRASEGASASSSDTTVSRSTWQGDDGDSAKPATDPAPVPTATSGFAL